MKKKHKNKEITTKNNMIMLRKRKLYKTRLIKENNISGKYRKQHKKGKVAKGEEKGNV